MIPEALQPTALLAHPKALSTHLQSLLAADPSPENLTKINTCILSQVHAEAIPASVFELWLQLTRQHSPSWFSTALVSALHDPTSYGVRRAAIKLAGRRLFRHGGDGWKKLGWDVLGGPRGVKEILDSLPLAEVRELVKGIFGRCDAAPSPKRMVEVSKCVEEFLDLVEQGTDPWTERPLLPHVSHLAAYCSVERVEELLRSRWDMWSPILHHFTRVHTPLLRQIGVGRVNMPKDVRLKILGRCRGALLSSKQAYDPIYFHDKDTQSSMSPGLVFGIDLLMVIEKEPSLHSEYEIEYWLEAIMKKAIRERLPFNSILQILNLALTAFQATALAQPKSGRGTSGWLYQPLSEAIAQFWSISRFGRVGGIAKGIVAKYQKRRRTKGLSAHRDALEKCLIEKVLQVKDKNFKARGQDPREFVLRVDGFLSLVHKEGRLELLQLLCRHSPHLEFDLAAWPPSQTEAELIPCWHLNILNTLPSDGCWFLFRRSLHNYQCEEFLPEYNDKDTNSHIPSWEAQCLLWATWESISPKGNVGFPITRKAISEMKQKATRAREHDERRRWAEKAIKLAVKTSSIDIFSETVEWSKRFIRDPMVFPSLIQEILSSVGPLLSCRVNLQGKACMSESKADLLREAQAGHQILEDILQTCLLLLREPWARTSVTRITQRVPYMLSAAVGGRMQAIRKRPCGKSISESELVEILLDPMVHILLEYERQGNMEGQTDFEWSRGKMAISGRRFSDEPAPVELAFMDQLAKARDKFWQQHRAQSDPNVLGLSAGWPRGLPIQDLVGGPASLYDVIKDQDPAPFISSRANQVLFGAVDTVMTIIKPEEKDHVDGFVDDLAIIIDALLINDDQAAKNRDILRVWDHYSQILKSHSVYLGLFQDWLVSKIRWQTDMAEAANIIRPRPSALQIRPTVSPVPTGSEIIEWDPHEGDYPPPPETVAHDEQEEPNKVPCTIFNCRMEGRYLPGPPFVRAIKDPQPTPERLSIWSTRLCSPAADTESLSRLVQDSVILAALLFLDTYTKTPRILRTKFPPDADYPRYTPIYLADEFIALYQSKSKTCTGEALGLPINALRRSAKRIPPQVLRDLIWSFLDTLKADPNASNYSTLLFRTFDLIEILLRTDKPQLATDVVVRVWKDFANESSLHRKISLVKLGRVLTPEQGRQMMKSFTGYVCDALQQSQQQANAEKKENRVFVKVTTAKMLAQALAEADFLSQSDRMEMLQTMFNSARHIDIRREIAAGLLELVSICDDENSEPYKVFSSMASSVAGPNERETTTETDWEVAENGQLGPLPYIAPGSERPVLELVVSTAANKVPEKLRSDYVLKVLLPLLQESTRQHTRWIAAMSARLGISISDLKLTEQEIGPFSPDLADRILSRWVEYLPGSYLQKYHRPWSLAYLQNGSFSRIDKALAVTTDGSLKEINVRDHWKNFLGSQRRRLAMFSLDNLLGPMVRKGTKVLNGLTTTLILGEFVVRAEVLIRNPVGYNKCSKQYSVRLEYALEPLRTLRKSRKECVSRVTNNTDKAALHHDLTNAMTRVVDICGNVRKEGWSPWIKELTADYPVTLPSNFEYDILMLPSPIYNPAVPGSDSAAELFTLRVLDLIRKYSDDPIMLLKFDSLEDIMGEMHLAGVKPCALRLGCAQREEYESQIEMCIRVKLVHRLLDRQRSSKGEVQDADLLEMIGEWKNSDIEFVRQRGWESYHSYCHSYR
ncbi:hypothetical protein BJY01DRAFT_244219 [Aspergillus pseudoustus]|uniref:Proteasome activator Blm10 mid region domain-containing protein n=1 Tax=Aspergillus pseudoustus TaxID=1810923 RepID=A0ABR4KLV1_9EURO